MVAPSINLEFTEGASFQKKAQPVPGLGQAIIAYLQSWPNKGTIVCKDIRRLDFANGGRDYVVVFTPRFSQVGLMNIFEVPEDAKLLEDYLGTVREIYCRGKK